MTRPETVAAAKRIVDRELAALGHAPVHEPTPEGRRIILDPAGHRAGETVAVLTTPLPLSALDRLVTALEEAYGSGLRISQSGYSLMIFRPTEVRS